MWAMSETKDKNKKLKKILLAVVGLQVVVVVATLYFVLGRSGGSGGGSGGGNMATFLPIWVAVFVPVFAAQQKKKPGEEKKWLYVLLGLGVAVLVAMVVFMLVARG